LRINYRYCSVLQLVDENMCAARPVWRTFGTVDIAEHQSYCSRFWTVFGSNGDCSIKLMLHGAEFEKDNLLMHRSVANV